METFKINKSFRLLTIRVFTEPVSIKSRVFSRFEMFISKHSFCDVEFKIYSISHHMPFTNFPLDFRPVFSSFTSWMKTL